MFIIMIMNAITITTMTMTMTMTMASMIAVIIDRHAGQKLLVSPLGLD